MTARKDETISMIPALNVGTNNNIRAKVDKIEPTFDQDINNVDFGYSLISDNGSCVGFNNTNKLQTGSFSYGFDKTKIRYVKMTFTTDANILNLKAYTCSSPAVEQSVQSLGNNQYSVVITASSTFIVTGDIVNSSSLTNLVPTGGQNIFALVVAFGTIVLTLTYITVRNRNKLRF